MRDNEELMRNLKISDNSGHIVPFSKPLLPKVDKVQQIAIIASKDQTWKKILLIISPKLRKLGNVDIMRLCINLF